jgi:hypothetical protein
MNNFGEFTKLIQHPVKYRMFLFMNLPAAFFSGLHVVSVNTNESVVSVQHKWFTKNPFHSIYFAVLSMAAEMSTGILAMGHLHKLKPAVSMLIVNMNGVFHKKGTGKIYFKCADGAAIQHAIEQAVTTNEPVSISAVSKGYNTKEELVAEFSFTWSFKSRNK